MKKSLLNRFFLFALILCAHNVIGQRYEYVILGAEPQRSVQPNYQPNYSSKFLGTYYGLLKSTIKEGDNDADTAEKNVKIILKQGENGTIKIFLPSLDESATFTATVQGNQLTFNEKMTIDESLIKVKGSGSINGEQLRFSMTLKGYEEDDEEVKFYVAELNFNGEKF
jgi:hypothetical protein